MRTANDVAGQLDRRLYPEDFWQAFRFTLSQNDHYLEPRDVRSDPIYGSAFHADRGQTLRGAIVWLEFDAGPFEPETAQVEVVAPTTDHVLAKFALTKLR